MGTETDAEEQGHSKRALAAGAVGNVIEWYDFTLYGYMAVVIAQLFFPHEDRTVSLIATYGVFAAGFLMRPLGGVLLGHLGDTWGRKPVMLISVVAMAAPTLLLGLLPTYADWGILASVALVVIRLVQGLSVGGEFSSSVTYLVETAPEGRRGFAACWANVGSTVGMLLGAATPAVVIWILGQPATNEWGWRIPFLLGGAIGLLALVLRRGLPEPPSGLHEVEDREGPFPLARLFREEPGVVVRLIVYSAAYGVVFYVPLVYLPNWLSLYTSIHLHEALFIVSLGLALQIPLIGILAIVSDRYVRRTHLVALAYGAMAVVAVPLYLWVGGGSVSAAVVVILCFCGLIAVPLAVMPATYAEAFDRGHRLTGYSVSFNLGFAVFGGTAPMVATWLIHGTGNHLAPAWYAAVWALVGTAAILSLKDRSREPLR